MLRDKVIATYPTRSTNTSTAPRREQATTHKYGRDSHTTCGFDRRGEGVLSYAAFLKLLTLRYRLF